MQALCWHEHPLPDFRGSRVCKTRTTGSEKKERKLDQNQHYISDNIRRHKNSNIESRRDQEEGGELDSHEEASPEGIKCREVVLV